MPAISIKGTTKNVTGRKEGTNIVIEKTIQGGTLIETYAGKRVNGKQAPGEKIALSAIEIDKLLSGTKNELNTFANKVLDKEVTKRNTQVKKLDDKVKTLTNKLAAVKQATKTQASAQTAKVDTVLKQKRKVVRTNKRLRGERNDLQTEQKKGTETNTRLRAERKDLQTENEKTVETNTRLRGERKELQTEVDKLKAQTAAKKEKKKEKKEKREKKDEASAPRPT
jgi:chromosome segregation ATPase